MRRIYTCLVGDLFHAGHVGFLRRARAEGDFLLVGVCSDEDCTHYKRRPVMNMYERAEVIAACRYVDEIILAPPSVVPAEFLDHHRIDLMVHGDDVNPTQLEHFYGDALRSGRYKSLPYTLGISTTDILRRIGGDKAARRRYFLGDPK